MATTKRELSILVTAEDKSSKELEKLDKNLDNLKKTVKKVSIASVAAFAAVSAGITKTVGDAVEFEQIEES